MLNTADLSHPSFIPSTTDHAIPTATSHSITPNETAPLTTTRQQRKVSIWAKTSQESRHRFAYGRRVTDVERPTLHDDVAPDRRSALDLSGKFDSSGPFDRA